MNECKHKWRFINSHESKESNQFCNIYERTDYFECEKCSEHKKETQRIDKGLFEPAPDWYRSNTYNK